MEPLEMVPEADLIHDLPVIRDNIRKGFLETQAKVNSWVTNFKRKIDGEDEDEFRASTPQAVQGYNTAPNRPPPFGRRSGDFVRRSAEHDRYDADPQLLGDDFTSLHLKDHEGRHAPPRRSSRPLANPDLFKPTPARPSSNNGRRVSFQDGPPEEIGMQQRATSPPDLTKKPHSNTGGKSSKWQPLASVDPDPVADHDPFSLGDSDDDEVRKKDVKAEDDNRSNQTPVKPTTDDTESVAARKSQPGERADGLDARNQGPDRLTERPTI
ncbi:MAG: hypothetical protein Q9169_000340 [Polycauliona sp. 2 TL-2023]